MLTDLMAQLDISLWGVASLDGVLSDAQRCQCLVFCLPYDDDAVDALPDDELIDRCAGKLAERARAAYAAIAEALPGHTFATYGEADAALGLRKRGVSQKVLGYLAGLGWIGRSSLLVTPQLGPRVRLCTLLTQGDLGPAGVPLPGRCLDCMACVDACPVGAITLAGYDVTRCVEVVNDAQGNYRTFCGLCMQACPVTRVPVREP